jgi:hypothetical protein
MSDSPTNDYSPEESRLETAIPVEGGTGDEEEGKKPTALRTSSISMKRGSAGDEEADTDEVDRVQVVQPNKRRRTLSKVEPSAHDSRWEEMFERLAAYKVCLLIASGLSTVKCAR